jgi:hypothetical protein
LLKQRLFYTLSDSAAFMKVDCNFTLCCIFMLY